MLPRNKRIIRTGFLACWLLVLGDWLADVYFSHHFPGYSWQQESISYLGQAGSPVEHAVKYWGIVFFVLLVLFARGYWEAFRPGFPAAIVSILIAIYGLGEGMGSGLFPINPPGTPFTIAAQWHEILSGIGDAAIILMPFVLTRMFRDRKGLRRYLLMTTLTGLAMLVLFFLAKWWAPDNFILAFKGLWQRIYVANYHVMLLVVSLLMIRR
ncbi:MAG: DUF998 domain-containing protein [Saprospiraceae bacterium]|nr:DUF998 domain-containing protein [Saprospiraceae bacterium]